MRLVLSIATCFLTLMLQAQGVDRIRNFSLKSDDFDQHHSIQPAIRVPEVKNATDSIRQAFRDTDTSRSYFILPGSDSYFFYDTAINYRATIGVHFEKTWGKWYNRSALYSGWTTQELHMQNHQPLAPIHNHAGSIFTDFRTRFAFTPNEQLHLSAGCDNQFFGEGYRSLVQGEQVAPNPFVQLRASFWRLEYGLLYQFMHENHIPTKMRDWKYNTTHYLSWNATKNWNITILESIVFRGKDSTYKRGYEIEYLNPFVFFRPQEYSLGSTDNMLLALQSSHYFLDKKHAVYLQLALDEFALKELVKRTKWWANKFGVQFGIKGKFEKWNYQLEGNLVRPYTFSHITSAQNNGQLGRALGHYLGSNFAELLASIQVPLNHLKLQLFSSFVLKGYDENGINYGGDIYKSYLTHPKEYGNTIGQGVTVRTVNFQGSISTYWQKAQLELYLQLGFQIHWGDISTKTVPVFGIGVRNNLFVERKLW